MREYLKQIRRKNDLTQQNVEILSGIKANYYSMIENGERQSDMSLSTMQKLAKAFDITVDEIVQMETEYQKEVKRCAD